MRDALQTWHIGRVIYVYRTHPWHGRTLSQDLVAGWLGLTQPQLSRMENGRALEDLGRLVPYAQTLGIPSGKLWFQIPGTPEPEVSHAASPVPAAPASTGTGESDTPDRLSYALKHPAATDLVTVAHLRQQVHRLDEQYVHLPSTALLADTGQYLGQIRFLAAHATKTRVRRELHAVEAETAILMAQLVWDASQRRDQTSPQTYLDQAITAARTIQDPASEGLALLRKSMIALYGDKNPADGLALTEAAATAAGRSSAVLSGLAVLHGAEAHAMLGDLAACEADLTTAERCFEGIRDMDVAIDLWSETQLGRMAGSCYLSLDRARRAQDLLEATASCLTDGSKPQAIVLGNLALAHIRQGNPDEAAGRLHEAIDIIELNWGGGGLNIVFGASKELRRWRDVPAVQDVSDRLLTLLSV